MTKPMISVVVPCFNEQEALPHFMREICRVAEEMREVRWEFCFVDDGSKDETITILRTMAAADDRIHYTSFSRNFGKEAAILAGLKMTKGDYVVLMDADLQHPPAMIPEMFAAVKDGEYDVAAARRTDREGEPKVRSFFARKFYKIMNRISSAEFVDGATDFRLMRRAVVDAIIEMPEYNRFTKGIFAWIGFKTKWLPYQNVERVAGETKWSFWKLLRYSLEGIVSFSTAPLVISSIVGLLACVIAVIMLIVVVIKTLIVGNSVAGYPTIVSLILLVGGLLMFFIGILGQYLSKTYLETKGRPVFIVRETDKNSEKGDNAEKNKE